MDKTYKPDQVMVTVGATIVDNFVSITVSSEEDKWSFSAGSGGEETRTKNSNKHGTITLEIPQTTAANLGLSTIFEADATVPVSVSDLEGNSLHVMPTGSIVKMPVSVYNKSEDTPREWPIGGRLSVNIAGGN